MRSLSDEEQDREGYIVSPRVCTEDSWTASDWGPDLNVNLG